MDVLLRHTVLGGGIRRIQPSRLPYADELDSQVARKLVKIQDAPIDEDHIDESSALLARGQRPDASRALLVDWYDEVDQEV